MDSSTDISMYMDGKILSGSYIEDTFTLPFTTSPVAEEYYIDLAEGVNEIPSYSSFGGIIDEF